MLKNGNADVLYNDYSEIPFFPYKVIEIMLTENSQEVEDFWKMLKYDTIDCLKKNNLTLKEKKSMIWDGSSQQENFSVFFKPLVGVSLSEAEEQTQVRIYRRDIQPTTTYDAIVLFEIDFITNETTSLVKKNNILTERTDLLETTFLNFMNGRDISIGSGYLTFDRELSRACNSQLSISNSRSVYGRALVLGMRYVRAEAGEGCG